MLQNDEDAPFNSIWNCIDDFSHSPLDDMLDNGDVTLEQVLNEDTLIQEVKGSNSKVIRFLATEENVSKLLDFLTKNPPQPSESQSQEAFELALYKYPYIACELFCCDIGDINGVIESHPPLIAKFFEYLQNNTNEEANLNPARSGYVLRAFGTFLDKHYVLFAKHLFQLNEQFQENQQDVFLEIILNQIHLPDMENFLLRLLGFAVENHFEQDFGLSAFGARQFRELLSMENNHDHTASDEKKLEVKNWAIDNNWIEKSLAFLNQHPDDEFIQMNLFGALAAVVEKGDNPISLHIMRDDVLSNLIQILLKHADSPLYIHGVDFLQKLIDQNDVHYESDHEEQKIPAPIAVVANHTEEFKKLLAEEQGVNEIQPIETPSGTIQKPLGETRLYALQLLRRLFRLKYPDMQRILVHAGAFTEIVRVFFAYNLNNIMHSNGYTVIYSVLHEFPQPENLIQESGLLEKLILAYKDCQQREKNGDKSSALMGHVVSVVNQVTEVAEHNPEVAALTQQTKGWEKFIRVYINQRNEIASVDLGGPRINSSYSYDQSETFSDSSSDEDDDELSPQKMPRDNEQEQNCESEQEQISHDESLSNGDTDNSSKEDANNTTNNASDDMVAGGFDDDDDFDADFDSA